MPQPASPQRALQSLPALVRLPLMAHSRPPERMLQALGVDENTLVALNERWLAGLAHRRKEPLPGDPPKLAIRDFLDAALLSPLNHHMISMLTDLLVATNGDEEH